MLALAYLLAVLIGLTLGVFGGGGSILTVPVFVYVLQFDPKLAIAMSLPVVGVTSLVGAARHWQAGNVQIGRAVFFGAFAMTGAYVAARLANRLHGPTQLFLLGLVMMVAATLMMVDSARPRAVAAGGAPQSVARLTLAGVGIAVGTLTGVIGVGGGFLIVPALAVFAALPMHQAVGTSLLIIAMNSAAAFAGQASFTAVPAGTVIVFTLCAVAGIIAGTQIASHVSARNLKRAFAGFLVLIAAWLLWLNWPFS